MIYNPLIQLLPIMIHSIKFNYPQTTYEIQAFLRSEILTTILIYGYLQ